jgi:DNA polymerase-3 subunit gamma/tau
MIDDEDDRRDDDAGDELPPGTPGAWADEGDPDTLSDGEETERDDLTLSMFADDEAPAAPAPAATGGPGPAMGPVASCAATTEGGAYLVLARKYRPRRFEDMIGQEAMVRTLTNAFATDRIAHAYMLTGVRGVGKTTTARLIARALNYSRDGADRPSIQLDPLGVHCADIQAGRHPDVFELDAASRTGVADMRELLDGVRYGPISARYKVYVIDEVHMLSTAAFNALLKTLEEPPPHAKFIFATTEIHKVPVTILSRCQRFDLRRVEVDRLAAHLGSIAATEGARIGPDALELIARAAEGSVRDGLSLLDQAIVQDRGEGVGAAIVRDMLGLADRTRSLALLEAVAAGDAAGALTELASQYTGGAQADLVLRALMDLAHEVGRAQALGPAWRLSGPVDQAQRIEALAQQLTPAAAGRLWQILLRGFEEAARAPDPMQAADMCLLRACAAQKLPGPEELARMLGGGSHGGAGLAPSGPSGGLSGGPSGSGSSGSGPSGPLADAGRGGLASGRLAATGTDGAPIPAAEAHSQPADGPATFEALLAGLEAAREVVLVTELERHVHLVRYSPGEIVLAPTPRAAGDIGRRTTEAVTRVYGPGWTVQLLGAGGAPAGLETLDEARKRKAREALEAVEALPEIQAALKAFPGARVLEVRSPPQPEGATVVTPAFGRNRS